MDNLGYVVTVENSSAGVGYLVDQPTIFATDKEAETAAAKLAELRPGETFQVFPIVKEYIATVRAEPPKQEKAKITRGGSGGGQP